MSKKIRSTHTLMKEISGESGLITNSCFQRQERLDQGLLNAVNVKDHIGASQLLTMGADIEVKYQSSSGSSNDGYGDTPLMRAIRNRDVKMVEICLENKADQNAKNYADESVLQLAWEISDAQVFEALVAHGLDANTTRECIITGGILTQSLLAWAIYANEIEFARFLLTNGADPNEIEKSRSTDDRYDYDWEMPLLIVAIDEGNEQAATLLLEYGANPNDIFVRNSGDYWSAQPALEWAVIKQHSTMVHLLLDRGADANVTCEYGCHPYIHEKSPILAIAVEHQALDIVRALLEHGANPNVQARLDGSDNFRAACDTYDKKVEEDEEDSFAKLVSELSCDTYDTKKTNFLAPTILSGAIDLGNLDVAELLVKFGATVTPGYVEFISKKK